VQLSEKKLGTMGMGEEKIQHILVAVDASPPSFAALEAAAEMAAMLGAELITLFVEDIMLLRLAESPFAIEIGLSSGSVRRLNTQQMQRQLRAQANRVRRRLTHLAERWGIPWSFRIARGAINAELIAAASEVDLVILGRMGWSGSRGLGSTAQAMASQQERPALIHAPRVKLKPQILVIYDGSETAQRSLKMAASLVKGQGGYLTVAILADEHEEAKGLQIEAAMWLRSRGLQSRYRWLLEADEEMIKNIMQMEKECILVLPGELPLLEGERLTALLDDLKCPVMVVR
jgi:nucleotide-binding universal stress UspA family protein